MTSSWHASGLAAHSLQAVNGSQRVAVVVALAVGLYAVGLAVMPFRVGVTSCGVPLIESFRTHSYGRQLGAETAQVSGLGSVCQSAARNQLARSGTVVVLDAIGWIVAWRLLKPQDVGRASLDEGTAD